MAKWPVVNYDGTTRLNGADVHQQLGGNINSATEANAQQEVRDTYTADNMRVYLSTWVGGAGADDLIVTFRKNGADGNQTLTINATGEHQDTVNSDSLVSGDLIHLFFDHSAGGHADEYTSEVCQVTLDASSDVPPIWAGSSWAVTAQAEFASLVGSSDEAVVWLDRIRTVDSEYAESFYLLGKIHFQAGRLDLAAEHMSRFLERRGGVGPRAEFARSVVRRAETRATSSL